MSNPVPPPTSGSIPPASSAPLGYQSGAVGGVESDPAQRSTAMIAHILGLLGILGTGIWYLVKKNDPTVGPFARDQMKEAFNFQLAVLVAIIGLNILSMIVVAVTHSIILSLLIALIMFAIWIGVLVLLIMNAIKANRGELARYPVRIPAIK